MKNYLVHDEWCIIEDGFHPKHNKISESVFSIGNGRMGQRANFEEFYSGDSLQGSYVAGIYYPDKTRVGWWKNGYPEYFAKVLNSPNWIGIKLEFDGVVFDLAECEITSFKRVLNMQEGYLERSFTARMDSGLEVQVNAKRFCSIAEDEIGAIEYRVSPLNYGAKLTVTPSIDADIINEDSNYGEKFWNGIATEVERRSAYIVAETKKTAFQTCTGMKFDIHINGEEQEFNSFRIEQEKYVACAVDLELDEGAELVVKKYVAITSSLNYPKADLLSNCQQKVEAAFEKGFDQLLEEQKAAWKAKWEEADIVIEGDVAAQQGIRFNIFQLYQTYTGEDERLNIGPKGFTGEKYGGSTYWDTEAYCFPFYLATADQHVARNLLIYRYKQLDKAIENAAKLGFTDGAALFPMVTMTGEECHNEWEITFEEIHRNGAIAYAVYNYIRYTNEQEYLIDYGLELLIAISRFWSQRVHFSKRRGMYVMHGVTGPNEYENNVNNNWHTNYIARWCLTYTMESLDYVKTNAPEKYEALKEKIKFYEHTETNRWKEIVKNIYLPHDQELDVFVQHDGFLDKELLTIDDLKEADKPINQNWSWDRILRSVYIKQADVLQGIYFFEDHFDEGIIRRNFDFYEPRTVHESSLSPCVHAVLAAKLGKEEKAYEMYLRTARLDLDDYNNDTEDGCHITSMAGTWMAVVQGFGGMRVRDGKLILNPFAPSQWKSYSFKIRFRGALLKVKVDQEMVEVCNESDQESQLLIWNKVVDLAPHSVIRESLK
jgi:maltose phosphorylase